MKYIIQSILAIVLIVGVIWIVVSAGIFNVEHKALCESHGMEMVQSYFGRGYGCGIVIPFDEVGK